MTRILKCFLIISLLLSSFSHSVRLDIHAENEPVDCDITFTENGLVVSSSDSDFLASIESIEMKQDDLSVKFASSEWSIEDNKLTVYGGLIYASGFYVGNDAEITVSALGYGDIKSAVQLSRITVKDSRVSMNSQGYIVIESSDDYFLQELGAPNDVSYIYFDNKTYNQRTYLRNTKENNVYYYEDGKVVIPSDVLVNKQYHNGNTYTLTVQVASYTSHTLNEEITFKGGVYANPSVKFDDIGLRIYSEDLNYVDQITKIEIKTFTDSVVEFDTEDWTISEHTLTLAGNKILEHGLERYTNYYVFVHAQDYAKVFKILSFSSFSVVNAGGYLDELGNLVIESDDSYWLNSFVEGDGELKIGDTYFRGSDFKKVNQQIMIQTDTLVAAGFNNGKTYEVRSYVKGYYDTVLGEVSFTGGAYTHPVVEYTKSGVFIYSSNQDYLDSVNSILVVVNVTGDGTYEGQLSSKDWVVTEGQIFIPGGKIWEAGEVQPSGASITGGLTIIAEGYAKVISNTYFNWIKVDDVSVEVDDEGNVRINSSDKYWLRLLYEKSSNYALQFLIDSTVYASIYNSNQSGVFLFENGQLIVPAQTLINHGLLAGATYEITTAQFPGLYYYKEIGSVTLTKGIYKKPSDIKIKMNQEGDLIISSKDSAWLNAILQAKEKTGKSSVELYHDKDGVKYTYEFYNDENQSDLTLTDEGIVIQSELLIQRGMVEGTYFCNLNAYLYANYSNSINVQGLKCSLPEDVSIVQDDDGNLVISSSDTIWLNGLLENRTDQFAVEVLDENQECFSFFWNTEDVTDLVMENGNVVIPLDVIKMRCIYADSYCDLKLNSRYYDDLIIENVYFKDGVVTAPDDLEISFDMDGNLVVSTSNSDYLEKLVETRRRSDFPAVQLFGEYKYHIYNDANTTALFLEDNQVVLHRETMKSYGMTAGTYTVMISAFGYEIISIEASIGLVKQPPEFSVQVDESGDIVIESEDTNWLEELVSLRDEYAAVYVFDKNDEYVAYFWNLENWTDLKLVEGKVIIDSNAQKYAELLSSESYTFQFYVEDYAEAYADILIVNGSKPLPEDLTVFHNEQKDVMIQTQDQNYLDALKDEHSYLYLQSDEFYANFPSSSIEFFEGYAVISRQALLSTLLKGGIHDLHLYAHGYVSYYDYDFMLLHALIEPPKLTASYSGFHVNLASKDQDYLEAVESFEFIENTKGIQFKVEERIHSVGNGTVLLHAMALSEYGFRPGEYAVRVYAKDYETLEVYLSVPDQNPADVTIEFDSKTGDLWITSNDLLWIAGLVQDRTNSNEYDPVHVYDEDEWLTYFVNNDVYQDLKSLIFSAVIKSESIQQEKLLIGKAYDFAFCSSGYNGCVWKYDVAMKYGVKEAPSDIAITVDENTGDLLISAKDKEWMKNVVLNNEGSDEFTHYILMKHLGEHTYFYNSDNYQSITLTDKGLVVSNENIVSKGIPAGNYEIMIKANGYAISDSVEVEVQKGAVQVPEDTSIVEDEQGNLVISSSNQAWLEEIVKPLDQYAPLGIYNDNTEAIFYNWVNETCFELHDGKVILLNDSLKTHSVVNGTYLIKINILGYTRFTYENVEITKGAKVSPEDIEYYLDDSGNLVVQSSDDDWLKALVYASEKADAGFVDLAAVNSEFGWGTFSRQSETDTSLVLRENQVIVPKEMLGIWLMSGEYRVIVKAHDYARKELGLIEIQTEVSLAPKDVKISIDSSGNLKIKSSNNQWLKDLVNSYENGYSSIYFRSSKTNDSIQNTAENKRLVYSSGTVTISNKVLKKMMIPNDNYTIMILVEGYQPVEFSDFSLTKSVDYVPDDLTVVQNEEGMIQICTENQSYLKNISSIGLVLSGKKIKLKDDEVHVETGSLNVPLDTLLKYGVAENQEIQLKISSKNYQNVERNLTVHTGAEIINEPVEIGFDEYGNLLIMSENQDYLDSIQRVVVALKIDTGNVQYELTQRKDTASGVIFYTGSIKEDMTEVEADLTVYSYGYECLNESQVMIDSVDGIKSVEQRVYVGDQLTLEATNLPNQKVTWSTSDKNIATVDKNGVVKFLKAGTVKITGKAYGKSMKVTLVCESIKLSVSASSTKPIVGDVVELNVTNSTDRDIIWTVSNENVVLNEETLTVEAVGPGSATVSAKINGVTKSVKFTVYTVESGAKLKSEVVDYDKAGMELGEVKTLNIFTDKSEETINEHMKFTSSNTKVATVDEDGNITAIAKGTAKITASIANDPDGRKITVEVKVIDRQARAIEVVIDDEAVERNGNELLVDYEMVGKNYKIVLDEILIDRDGNELTTGVKWSTSDSKVASVKTEKNVNYLVIAGGGQIELTCTANDARKESVSLTLRVVEYAPRLEDSKLTVNKYSEEAAEMKVHVAYDTEVSEVRVLEYNQSTKKYEETENFVVELNEGNAYLRVDEAVKKGTYKLKLEVTIDTGRSYGYELSATVAETLPSPTIKVSGYINTFDLSGSTLAMSIDHKGNEVTHMELDGTEAFVRNFSIDEEDNVEIHGLEKEANGKLTVKGTLRIYYEGYKKPVEKSISFTTKSVKPSWKVSSSSVIVAKTGYDKAMVQLVDSNKNILDLDDSYNVELVSGSVEDIYLDTDTDQIIFSGIEKSSTLKFEITNEAWASALSFSVKVTVSTSLPKVKIGQTTVTLNKYFSPSTVTMVSLDQLNMNIARAYQILEAVNPNAETEKIEVLYSYGGLYAYIKDISVKAGSYKYELKLNLEDGTALKPVTFTVKVDASEPTYKLSKTSIKLNKKLENPEQITMTETLSKNTYNTYVEGIEVRLVKDKKIPAQDVNDVKFVWSEDGIVASLNDTAIKGKYTYYIRPIYEGGIVSAKEVKLTVEVYENAPTVKTSVSGSLNPIDPTNESKVTVTLSNLVDTVASVVLEDERFTAEVVDGKIIVKLSEGETVTDQTVSLKAHITTATTSTEFDTTLKVKVARSAPKITVTPATLNMYETSKKNTLVGSAQLTLKGNGEVAEIISQNKESVDAGYRAELRVTEDGTYVDIYLVDAVKVKSGSTTSLKYQVIFKGESNAKKAPSITIKVADKSTSVKWSVLSSLFR